MNDQLQQLMNNAPAWAREPAFLIGAGVILALLLVWLLSRVTRRRPRADEIVEPDYEEALPVVRPITPPPVSPPPPPIVEEPLAPPVIHVGPEGYVATEPTPEPEPELAAEPEPEPTSPYIPDEAPEPAIADEPIAAAAPFDASPASIAADVSAAPEPGFQPEPIAEPAPTPQPDPSEPVADAADDLTRMKGVGPRLADRLHSLGIVSFAEIAALTQEDADTLDSRLGDFQGRIHRDRWIEQAGYLASGDVAGFEEVFGRL